MTENDELKHVGVLGMKWGRRKGGSESSGGGKGGGGAFSKNRSARIKTANELAKVRATRSKRTKLADWLLSGPGHQKLWSETHGKNRAAIKGNRLSNKLEEQRRFRSRGEKILDGLMTPGRGTKTFTERPARERRKIVLVTAAAVAAIGVINYAQLRG